MHDEPAIVSFDGTTTELPTVRGSEDVEVAIDIAKLRSRSGHITLDNGFINTGSCKSAITFVDGEAGILRYRGIQIEDLVSVPPPSFLETAYLLIYGELPTGSNSTSSATASASTRSSTRT